MRISLTMSTLLCVVAAGLLSRSALACSPPAPGVFRSVEPAKGAAAVPTNVQVRVHYQDSGTGIIATLAPPQLHDAAGEQVQAKVATVVNPRETIFVLEPAAPLVPGAKYTVVDWLGTTEDFCGQWLPPLCTQQLVAASTFTVGTAPDTLPPTFGGLQAIANDWQSCDDSACCGPYSGWWLTFKWAPATDDGPVGSVRYNVYRHDSGGKTPVARFLTSAAGASVGGYLGWAANLGAIADGLFSACAVDSAGQETCAGAPVAWQALPPPVAVDADATSDGDLAADDAAGLDATDIAAGETDGDSAAVAPEADASTDALGLDASPDSQDQDADAGVQAKDATAPLPPKPAPTDSGCTAQQRAQPRLLDVLIFAAACAIMRWRRQGFRSGRA